MVTTKDYIEFLMNPASEILGMLLNKNTILPKSRIINSINMTQYEYNISKR